MEGLVFSILCKFVMAKISIVIPIYNEEGTLLKILKKVENANTLSLQKEIVLIDDGSFDGTREILKNLEKKHTVVYHSKNQGKGAALKTGFQKASGDIILIQDADLELDPRNYPNLIEPILSHKTEVVYGSRYLKNNKHLYRANYFGTRFISWLISALYRSNLTDVCCGYKVFRASVLKNIKFESNGFEIEQELTIKITQKGNRIMEIPVDFFPRTFKEGKKIRWWSSLSAILPTIKHLFVR